MFSRLVPAADPAWVSLTASPAVIQPTDSKLPASTLLAVFAKDCSDTSAINLSATDLKIAAPGLTLSGVVTGKCMVTGTLNIDPKAPAGNYKLLLVNKSDGRPIGSADFAVLDTSAGPIPPGLAPEVDVMWEVLSHKVCEDVFGRRVERNFYCIEIKVGNNTGHPIQLAGIGFSKHLDNLPGSPVIHANTSYASTRAVLLRETYLSGRNQFYHSVEATGLIMAGFIPFFHAANPTAHYATATSIVSGPLLQAINVVRPDRVVAQLNNLDDESFRDNQIIPNNSQVRTIVFIEKRALYEQIASVLESDEGLTATLTKQPKAKKKTKNKVNESTTENGTTTTTTTTEGEAATTNQNLMEQRLGSGVSEPVQKDVTKTLQNTLKNSRQKDTTLHLGGGDFSPFVVKRALGNVVIVGDEIEYLQRVQVQGAGAGAPAGLTVLPGQVDFGNVNVDATSDPPQTITITNSTSNAMNLSTPAISGTNANDFTVSDNQCGTSLAAGAKCTVKVIFKPTNQNARGATLTIAVPGGANQTVALRGVGIATAGTVSLSVATLQFDPQKIGTTSAAKTVTLTNTTGGSITGIKISLQGDGAADYAQTAPCDGKDVATGGTCDISVTFKPLLTSARTATLNVVYTIGGSQQFRTVTLSGTGQ